MSKMTMITMAALASLAAAPLSAQIVTRDSTIRERVEAVRRRAEASRRTDGATARSRVEAGEANRRGPHKIPRGHLPPEGMCRVWIDGVPPGRQPAVTDCVTAERNRTANSRVIYGDRESFPGKGKGKFKDRSVSDDRDDLFEDDDERDRTKLSKAEKQAAKAARKGNRGRGR